MLRYAHRKRMSDSLLNYARLIEWRAIAVACVYTLVAGAVVGFGWGLFGAFLMATGGPYRFADTVFALEDGAHIIPFALSLLPEVIGGIYLGRVVRRGVFKHCFILGIISLSLSFVMSLALGDVTVESRDLAYFLAIVPAAVLGGVMGDRC